MLKSGKESLLILTSDFPPDQGGLAEYSLGLADNLAGLFPRVVVLAERRKQNISERKKELPYELEEVFVGDAPFSGRVVGMWSRAWRIVRRHAVNRIFAVTWSPGGVVARALCLFFDGSYYVAAHGLEILEPQRSRKFRFLMRVTLAGAARVFPVSSFTHKEILKLGVQPSRTVSIPCGTNPEKFEGTAPHLDGLRRRYQLENKKVLLTVGRLVRRKGHDLVIEALHELQARHPNLVYVIAGEGQAKADLERLVRSRGLQERVVFTGLVPEQELPSLYHACDIFVMPCRSLPEGDVEGFGIVFLEANACGKPVIAGRSGGVEDAVIHGETGLLIEPDDRQQLVQAIARLIQEPELRQRLGRQGRERVRQTLNWPAVARRLSQEMLS